jgi:type I restriction enzyme S subunit
MTEGPYKLPEGWRWVRLGEVAFKPQYGYTTSAVTEAVGPKFLRITDISSGEIDWESVPYCSAVGKVLEKYKLRVGDVLFARSGSVGATVVIRETPPDAVFASYLIRVRLREEVLPEYAEWLLKAPVSQSQLVPQGAAQKNINARHIEQVLIPLPPLEEQRRIVARIEELMGRVREARRLRQEAQKDAERLWQSVLAQTFPRPGSDLPKGWRWVRLVEVCYHRTGIWGPQASDPSQGFPIVRSTEIDGFLIRPQSASVRAVRPSQVDAYKLEAGDILVNKSSGSPHLVGWPAIFEDPQDGRTYLFSNFMLRLRLDQHSLEPWFLLYYLHSPIARSIYLGAQDTTSGLRNLRIRDFMVQRVPLPPLAEQRRIVAHLEAVQERIKALKEAQFATDAELKRLEQAILEKAFRREL